MGVDKAFEPEVVVGQDRQRRQAVKSEHIAVRKLQIVLAVTQRDFAGEKGGSRCDAQAHGTLTGKIAVPGINSMTTATLGEVNERN